MFFTQNIKIVEVLLNAGCDMEEQDYDGHTPLFEAVRLKHLCIVRMLIAKRCNINTADNSGTTPLNSAVLNYDTRMVIIAVIFIIAKLFTGCFSQIAEYFHCRN